MLINFSGQKVNHGFSMIEILVTLLIFAIGILGVASLQTNGMRLTRDAELTGKANILASSMADRMRANLTWTSGYVGIDGTDRTCLDEQSQPPNPTCSDEEFEIIEWNEEISAILPNGSGAISFASPYYTISVTWTESQDSSQSNNIRQYDLPVRL